MTHKQTELRILLHDESILTCQRCNLCQTRTQVVLGRGHFTKTLLIVGEAPGANEDVEALPFIGLSGILLEKMLTTVVGISTQDCFVTNVIKCRPVNNKITSREPLIECYSYLYHEITTLNPTLILTLGNTPTTVLLGRSEGITELNGKLFYEPLQHPNNFFTRKKSEKKYTEQYYLMMPLFHPSALLRNSTLEAGSKKHQVAQALRNIPDILENPDKYRFLYSEISDHLLAEETTDEPV